MKAKRWLLLALANLLVATLLGALLRFAFVREISWINYRSVMHAHSHVAMLGWICQALMILLSRTFVPAERQAAYVPLLALAQLSVLGMLICFPIFGYAGWSIAFSTLHLVALYWFAFRFWRDLRPRDEEEGWWLRLALIFLLMSTLPILGMGPIIALQLQGTALYYAAIQFYLHYQFNGWFLFAAIALALRYFRNRGFGFSPSDSRRFRWWLTAAVVLTYALAVAWSTPLPMIFAANSLGVLAQVVALVLLWRLLRRAGLQLHGENRPLRFLWALALGSLVAKVLMQSALVLPFVAKAAYTIHNYVIGFIHLLQLGIFTATLLAFALGTGLLTLRRLSRFGLGLLFTGFLLSEGWLFLQGTFFWGAWGFLPAYYEVLFAVS
ncbi:MAG: hypothetical protein KDC54_00800, partial [Lewinella sp.]|nr:hypothetical protein [Lewinella sp.]